MNDALSKAVMENPPAALPPARALSVGRRPGLGTGGLPDLGMQFGIRLLASPLFNVGLGVSPWVIGVVMALPRFMKMFLDPWVVWVFVPSITGEICSVYEKQTGWAPPWPCAFLWSW